MTKLNVANAAQKIIFCCEMQGQLSDGAWENSRPWDHWEPWSNLKWDDVLVNPTEVGTTVRAPRHEYAMDNRNLLSIVGTRIQFKVAMFLVCPPLVVSLLENDHWAFPDDVAEMIQYAKTSEYYAKKLQALQDRGITTEWLMDIWNRKDEIYPMKQLRADCRGLKLALRTCI